MSVKTNPEEPDLGYRFWPKKYPQSAGHPRLDINIFSAPSEMHFDPKVIRIPVFTSVDRFHPQGIEQLKVHHPWLSQSSYHVAPGMLIISDRKDKKVEAFTFGGTLQIDGAEKYTKCVIQSDAPIIEIDGTNTTVMTMVEEIEIILAERRILWVQNEEEFEARLEEIPPSVLYAACLEELKTKIDHSHSRETSEIQDFNKLIAGEKRSLIEEGLWPEKVPSISEIL
jgi:hypothetical protein